MTYPSFAALGDSFTEGLQDDLGPDGRHRGWADRTAAALARRQGSLQYANLAVRGRLLAQVLADQVPLAVRLRPALVTFHAGVNDLLRPAADVARVARGYRESVGRLRETGAEVVVFTVIAGSGGSGGTARRLAERFGAFNETVRTAAAEFGALVTELGGHAALRDRRLWHEDRLHLSAEGHARVSAAVLETLGERDPDLLGGPPGWWTGPLPAAVSRGRARELAADARWVRQYFLPWVGRRLRGVSSGDLVPAKHAGFVTLGVTGDGTG